MKQTVSIIIPVKPGGEVSARASIGTLDYPESAFEVMVAEGTAPSRQRNAAVAEASGEIVYFLDDDSRVSPDALNRLSVHFEDPRVAVVGGPSLTPENDTSLQQAIGVVISSPFGGAGVRNRYRRHGVVRSCGQNELILCNLAFRASILKEFGGFDERLYPNEENELLDRLAAGGYRLLHDPDLAVERSQRPSYGAFARQMLGYGRGRGEQTRLAGLVSPLYLAPLLPLGWLLLVPFLPVMLALLPVVLYSSAVLGAALAHGARTSWRSVPLLCLLFATLHLLYGLGLVTGLAAPRYHHHRGAGTVTRIRRVKGFGEGLAEDQPSGIDTPQESEWT
jgi:cellulose synthase/poly-beta-1,6-N-acetylglucosamine synthase-like glycosyltransferase